MKSKTMDALTERFIAYSREINALELVPEGRLLKSRRLSYHFFDSGKFSSGVAIRKISSEYARIIVENFREDKMLAFDLLYGPPYKGTILVPSIAVALNALGCGNINFCSSRKERKNHGEGGFHIGTPIRKGSRVLIIDDVITAGTAIREVMTIIEQARAKAAGVIVALDRQEKGKGELSAIQEVERDFGIPVISIVKLEQIITYLEETGSEHLDAIRTYRAQYGINS